MDPIGPGNHERAWNDPPKFAFNSSGGSGIGNPSGRRRLLNKRVPVPTGPQVGNSPQHQPLRPGDGPPIGSPPLGTGAIGSPPLTKPPTDSQLSERMSFPRPEIPSLPESMTSEEILKEVESLFSNSVDKLSEDLKPSNELDSPEAEVECDPQVSKAKSKKSHREKIIWMHERNFTVGQIARQLGSTRSTVRKWIEKWNKGGSLKDAFRKGRPRKTNKIEEDHILDLAKTSAVTSAVEIKEKLNLNISAHTVRQRLLSSGLDPWNEMLKNRRATIINMKESGMSVAQIAKELKISRSTVYLWFRRWDEFGNLEDQPKKQYDSGS